MGGTIQTSSAAILIFLCLGLHLSCQQGQKPAALTLQTFSQVEQSNEELIRIAEDARRTLPIFFRHLSRAATGNEHFIKYPFTADYDSGIAVEQIWLNGIHFIDGRYYGILAGEPQYISGMEKGDTVRFNADEITDWMYIEDGKIAGGLSIRYLLERIPESQRSEEQHRMLQQF